MLAALRRAGTPYELSPGRLLRETLVTSGTMTNRVDRLAARGLVERLPDPQRPARRAGPADPGRPQHRRRRARGPAGAASATLLAGLDADDQRRLAGLLRAARRAVRGRGPVTAREIWLRFLSGPDIDALGLTRTEIVDAVESVVAAHGRGETVFEPRVHLVPDNGGVGHFNVLRGHVSTLGEHGVSGIKVVGDFVPNYEHGPAQRARAGHALRPAHRRTRSRSWTPPWSPRPAPAR